MSTLNVFVKKAPDLGLDRIIDRGWGNGYVCIPDGHPMHGLGYDDIHRTWDIDVNGGLTFAETGVSCKSYTEWGAPDFVKETDWIIGFDTAHWGDTSERWPNEESVLEEAKRLANQIESICTA